MQTMPDAHEASPLPATQPANPCTKPSANLHEDGALGVSVTDGLACAEGLNSVVSPVWRRIDVAAREVGVIQACVC
jgi:hypothetical protein